MNDHYNDIYQDSRNAAHNIRISFDANAWVKMKALLDKEDEAPVAIIESVISPAKDTKKLKWLVLLLAAFFTGSAVLIFNNNSSSKKPGQQPASNRKWPSNNNDPEKAVVNNDRPVQQPGKNNAVNNFAGQEAGFDNGTSMPVLIKIRYKKEGSGSSSNDSSNRSPLAAKDPGNDDAAADHVTKQLNRLYQQELNNEENQLPGNIEEKDDTAQDKKPIANSTTKAATIQVNESKGSKIAIPSTNNFFKHIGLTIVVSPEINTVNFKGRNEVTTGYGAGINYLIGKHFTLQAMFVNTRKLYATDKTGYTPIAGSSLTYYDSLTVHADCRVWDIPVNLRYSFTGNKQSSFFISAGISSYIMKKEIYNFTYYDQGSYYTKQRITDNENKHRFCNLNLTAGYQYWPGKKWSIGFEPYLKLPLSGIGAGKVKLTSAGALFSLSFHPL